ncbi:NAD(P)-dependent oxidoreductase [Rhizobium sp. KVB221]|uniref:NAD(P)-dependent oxidoreductase n=1 Tax=Rhizobium setariae TaxID=2801340 RepID=A0A936YQ95_9HYPH|nr:NAD(P)-dependent oxidoreductase [Rhizobium setariae]MBL0370410.1 NAD(P)-dependent oxidoreductase [Rhizobium setariae]
MTKIAFLGTGLMGAPMVRNLLKAGFDVAVWNRTANKAEALVVDGATLAFTPADAVAAADIIITMVSDGAAVRALIDGCGVARSARKGAVLVDMSSIKPNEARAHRDLLSPFGIGHIDAPVSGGTKGATDGTLAIMAGGTEEDFAKVEAALSAMGRPVLVGPSGSGQLSKLANQGIVATTIGIVAEAMLLMKAAGADMNKFRDALKGGFADSVILQQHGKRMADENFVPGGRSALQLKDLNNLIEAATDLGLSLPLSELQQGRFHRLVHEMDGTDLDHAGLYLELIDRQKK